jgi:YidC/Oxa1 family membrane protein insertase
MNDIRRTLLWVILLVSLVMLWDRWQEFNGRKAMFFPSANPTAQAPTAGASAPASVPDGVPSLTKSVAPSAIATGATGQLDAKPAAHETVQVQNDVLKLTLDTQGASVVRAELLQHADMADKAQPFVLFDESPERVYLAQTGLIAAGAGAAALPTHKASMTLAPGERSLKDGQQSLEVRFESAPVGGVKLIKTYTLTRGSYTLGVRHEVVNEGSTPVKPELYLQLVRDGNKPAGGSSFYSTFTGPALYTEARKYHKVEFADIDKGKIDIDPQADNGYVAMVQHYFASAWMFNGPQQRQFFVRKVDNNLYAVGMIAPLPEVAPGQRVTLDARLFAGPQEEYALAALTPGLELVKDYGWLTILAKPLYWLLVQLHHVLSNWGWSIMSLVLLLKIGFYWLNAKAYASMAKMKAINPRITEMRERLKDNPTQMQQEMMRIYREEKVNPLGGCLPIMVQIPVFIALYWVLLSSVDMRNAPWLGWIHDLSAPDPYYILPAIMALTTLLQTSLNPAPPDPLQAKMMWFMPMAFSIMFFFFPSGLVLYWITNNVLSIAQQWVINTRMGVPPKFHLPKF